MIPYSIALFILLFLAFRYVRVFRISQINPWATSMAFGIKVLVGFYFLYIYTEVYGKGALSADAGAFMAESALLNDLFYESPKDYFQLLFGIGDHTTIILKYLNETSHWDAGAQAIINDNRNILRIHSVIHFFSFGFSAIHVMVMCFISTIGLKQIFTALQSKTLIRKDLLFIILLVAPSVLFWTSGILKEPLMFLGVGLLLRGLFTEERNRHKLIYSFLGVLLLLSFKPYVLIALIPVAMFGLFYYVLPKFKVAGSLIILSTLLLISLFTFPTKRSELVHVLSRKQFDFKNVGKGGLHVAADSCFYFFEPDQLHHLKFEKDSVLVISEVEAFIFQHGSIDNPVPTRLQASDKKFLNYLENEKSDGYIELTMIDDSFLQLMKNIPEALKNTLFRPFIKDPGSWLKYPAMLEMAALFFFLFFALFRKRKLQQSDRMIINSILLFIITLSLIIGWVTPVLGAIVRYRIPVYLGILIIGLIMIDPSRKRINK